MVTTLSSANIQDVVHSYALPHFQPIVCRSHSHVSYEALGRVVYDGALLLPHEFFPLLCEAGAVAEFDFGLLPRIIAQMGAWKDIVGEVHVHINVSAEALRQIGYLYLMKELIHRYGVSPRALTIEVLENTSFWEDTDVLETLKGLRLLGLEIAIDDFPNWDNPGALLEWLEGQRLGVKFLKIDRSLTRRVCHIGESMYEAKRELREYVRFAHAHDIKVVAEGLEEEGDLLQIEALGVDYYQGDVIGKPMSASQVYPTHIDFNMFDHVHHHGIAKRMRSSRSF